MVTGFADDNDLEVHLSNINGTVDLAIVFRSVSEPSQLSYTLQYGFKDEIASSDSLSQLAKPRTLRSIFEENLLFPTMYAVFEVGHSMKLMKSLHNVKVIFEVYTRANF